MGSVADQIRDAQRRAVQALEPSERVERALAAGRLALEAYASSEGLDPREARRRLQRQKQAGRTPCSCMSTP